EVITNNVRSRIMREHLHDPAFYDRMSTLLAEVLADLKARRIDYEEFLKRMAGIAAQVRAGQAEDTPEPLKHSPGLRALYNTLATAPASSSRVAEAKAPYGTTEVDPVLELAQQLDARLPSGRSPSGSWDGSDDSRRDCRNRNARHRGSFSTGRATSSGAAGCSFASSKATAPRASRCRPAI